jgi:hypothetical protein
MKFRDKYRTYSEKYAKSKSKLKFYHFELKNIGWLKWEYILQNPKKETVEEKDEKLRVNFIFVYWWKLKSLISVAIHTNQFSEFLLPFLLAIAAPIVSVLI